MRANIVRDLVRDNGWKRDGKNIFTAKDGTKRVVYTHREGSWFGIGFSVRDTLKHDTTAQYHFVGPKRTIVLSQPAVELMLPYLPKSDGHYNVNITKEGAISTSRGPVQVLTI